MTFPPLAFTVYGLSGADLLTILGYFAAMLYIGWLFPKSNWELLKRNRDDWGGVAGTLVGVAGCVLLLWLIVWIGS